MKYSYNELKQLSQTTKNPQELAAMLIMRAFEVESIEGYAHGLENVVIGLVHSVEKHPNADKLNVAQVETEVGSTRQIVCGAPNLQSGQKVVVALPGAKLPGDVIIKQSKIRDVESNGMICSERELGIGEGHEGILVLDENAPIGKIFAEYAGLVDTILDIKILPDRGGDALSYRGLAREIASLEGRILSLEKENAPNLPEIPMGIEIASEKCSRYAGILFENISGKNLVLPFRSFLLVNGYRSISTPVDITNLFLLEYGQPMHAFDADTIDGKIIIRTAKENETLELLDGTMINLHPEDLVIADEKKALALAGVMGGKESSVTKETKRVLLEIAVFDPVSIRRSRTRHNIVTDAAYRYERGVDANLPGEAFAQAVSFFEQGCGAKAVGMTDVYPKELLLRVISFDPSLVGRMLGVKVEETTVRKQLEVFGFSVKEKEGLWMVTVPTRRRDLVDEWNLVEEIARTYGYENISGVAPILPLSAPAENRAKKLERRLKDECVASGMDEVMTYSFYGENLAKETGTPIEKHLELANPMNDDQRYMRAELLLTVLEKAVENARRFDSIRMFEFGSVFKRSDDGATHEEKRLAGVLSENESYGGEGFVNLKGELEAILQSVGVQEEISCRPLEKRVPYFHPIRTASICAGEAVLGVLGEIHPKYTKKMGSRRLVAFEISFGAVLERAFAEKMYAPLPKFPEAIRDISLILPKKTLVADVKQEIYATGKPLLRSCELFDMFDKGPEKNLSFHLVFGADDRTITSEEMQDSFDRIVVHMKDRFSAELHQ